MTDPVISAGGVPVSARGGQRRGVLLGRWRLTGVCVLVAACGRPAPPPLPDPLVTPRSPPLPLSQVFTLESWGAAPEDTVVTVPAGSRRIIAIRRGAPDHSLFALLTFPEHSLVARDGSDSVRLRITVPPGLYGLVVETDGEIRNGATVTFSYGMHFVAPAEARRTYGSEIRFEQFLGVGRLDGDSTLVFLDSWRPASDLLRAPLPGSGRYLVAAPRSSPAFRAIIW